MYTLGLTGSIGMGKTTVAQMFRENFDVPVICADKIVHDLYSQAETAAKVEKQFPGSVVDGKVDRKKLSELVVGNKDRIEELQELVHPLVALKKTELLDGYLAKGIKLVVVDVPLLFETKGEEAMTGTLVVSASEETQRARVLERPNMTQRKFEEIKKLQMSDEEKRERATFVIRTDCAMEETQAQVAKLIKEIVKE